ncbi:hypothetical protein V6x_61520 [Gimesia chilikensis]|uniref:Uncharacterized protein n=1 Tax=Gimesia chilikensis TaxID=2605989 RepID=A0A517WMC9_9PLAN|nr:hypothetical protein [Gimesia chilikensis]QDU06400.1 hypothetical protein V6x_61520 [Gimesia chilikensis]
MSPQDSVSMSFMALISIAVIVAVLSFLTVKYKAKFLAIVGVCLVAFIPAVLAVSYVSMESNSQTTVVQGTTAVAVKAPETLVEESSIPLPELPLVAPKPHDAPKAAQPKKTEPLPEWVNSSQEGSGGMKQVFQSGLFATPAEAFQDALGRARVKFEETLSAEHRQYSSDARTLSPELVRQVAMRRSYYQTIEHDFGDVLKSGESFKQDMYRAYVEVELSPSVKQTFYTKWKLQAGNQRVIWLGGAFAFVTLLCLGTTVYLRASHQ